jgi:hypothetical protein
MVAIAAIVLGVLAGSPAQSQPACPPPPAARLDLRVLDPELIRSHEHSANDIMDVSQKRSGIVNIGRSGRTMGLATYKPAFKLSGRPHVVQHQRGQCVSLAEVQISYGFEFHEVLVAKEFPVGSCEYQVVLDHEDTHVAFNRQTLAEYSGKLKTEIEAMLAVPPVHRVDDPNQAMQEQLKQVADRATPIVQEGAKVQRERNAGIDTRFSYAEAFKKCGNWDQGNIWLDGRPKSGADTKKPAAPSTPPPPTGGDPFGLGKLPGRRD